MKRRAMLGMLLSVPLYAAVPALARHLVLGDADGIPFTGKTRVTDLFMFAKGERMMINGAVTIKTITYRPIDVSIWLEANGAGISSKRFTALGTNRFSLFHILEDFSEETNLELYVDAGPGVWALRDDGVLSSSVQKK